MSRMRTALFSAAIGAAVAAAAYAGDDTLPYSL